MEYTTLETKQQIIKLDFCQRTYNIVLAKQYDKESRFIPIICTNNGQPFPINPAYLVHVKMLTPDKRAILNTVPIQPDGSLLLELTESMLSYPGKAEAEIRIFNEDGKKLLTTMSFFVMIEPSVYDDEQIISSDEFNALLDLMEKALKDYTYVIAQAQASADAALESEQAAKQSEEHAKESEQNAKESEQQAKLSRLSSKDSEIAAEHSAQLAAQSAADANTKSEEASNFARQAQSYALGTGDARPDEATDNAKYYYQQAKSISESFAGALRPMGTISFSDLPAIPDASEGDMYNISDAFTTTDEFKEGPGQIIPLGANIYRTTDGYWDVLAGTPVTGVKGNSETSYRCGNVNLTPENIGALPQNGNAISATKATQDGNGNNIDTTYLKKTGDSGENTAVYTSGDAANPSGWTDVAVMASGEKHKSLFNKLSTMAKNVRWLYKMLGTTNIASIGGGTLTGAISSLNTGLANLCIQSTYKNSAAITINDNATSGSIIFSLAKSGYIFAGICTIAPGNDFVAINSVYFNGSTLYIRLRNTSSIKQTINAGVMLVIVSYIKNYAI